MRRLSPNPGRRAMGIRRPAKLRVAGTIVRLYAGAAWTIREAGRLRFHVAADLICREAAGNGTLPAGDHRSTYRSGLGPARAEMSLGGIRATPNACGDKALSPMAEATPAQPWEENKVARKSSANSSPDAHLGSVSAPRPGTAAP